MGVARWLEERADGTRHKFEQIARPKCDFRACTVPRATEMGARYGTRQGEG